MRTARNILVVALVAVGMWLIISGLHNLDMARNDLHQLSRQAQQAAQRAVDQGQQAIDAAQQQLNQVSQLPSQSTQGANQPGLTQTCSDGGSSTPNGCVANLTP